MQTIAGELEAGEAQGTLAAIAVRQRGSQFIYLLAMSLLMGAGAACGYGLGLVIGGLNANLTAVQPLILAVGLWAGWFAYVRLCRPFLVRQFRRRMSDRDLDLRFRQSITIADEGLILESGSVRRVADWSAVTDVFRVKGYWIFLVQMEPWFAPSKFFNTVADERAFIGAALTHVSQKALARSKDAVAFAGPQP